MADIDINLEIKGDKKVKGSIDDISKGVKSATGNIGKLNKGLKGMGSVTKQLGKSFKSLGSSIFSVKGLIAGLGTAFAANKLITAANTQEDAINRLNVALKTSGSFSEEASKDMQKFASELQKVSIFGDELILNQIALAKSFGATNEQAKTVATAAANVAAALGVDLETATRQVAQTLSGTSGRLGLVVGDLRNLTAEQLKAGKGLDVLAKKFAGAAAGQVNTFAGATTQLSNTFGDLLEELGFIITTSPTFIGAIAKANEVFLDLQDVVKRNRDGIKSFIETTVVGLIDAFSFVATSISKLIAGYRNLLLISDKLSIGVDKTSLSYNGFIESINNARLAFNRFTGDQEDVTALEKQNEKLNDQNDILKQSIRIDQERVKQAEDSNDRIVASTENAVNSISEKLKAALSGRENAQAQSDQKTLQRSIASKEMLVDAKIKLEETLGREELKIQKDLAKQKEKLLVDEAKRREELLKKFEGVAGTATASPIAALTGGQDVSAGLTDKEKVTFAPQIQQAETDQAIGIAGGLAKSITDGAEGAKNLIIEGGAGLLKAVPFVGPALSAVAKPLLNAFSKGPEATKQMVKDFNRGLQDFAFNIIDAIPVFIQTLVEELPVLIERLADNIGPLVARLIASIPKLVNSLIRTIPRLITALTRAMPTIIQGFIDGLPMIFDELIKGLPTIISSFAGSMPEVALSLATQMPKVALSLIGSLTKGAPQFIKRLVAGAGDFVKGLVAGAGDFIKELISKLTGGLGGSGGGGGVLGVDIIPDSVPIIGGLFAKGGKVPEGFNSDNFVAGLSSGERVIRDDVNTKLESFLDGDNKTNLLLERVINLLESETVIESDVKLNSDTFGRILTRLDRLGTRVAI